MLQITPITTSIVHDCYKNIPVKIQYEAAAVACPLAPGIAPPVSWSAPEAGFFPALALPQRHATLKNLEGKKFTYKYSTVIACLTSEFRISCPRDTAESNRRYIQSTEIFPQNSSSFYPRFPITICFTENTTMLVIPTFSVFFFIKWDFNNKAINPKMCPS